MTDASIPTHWDTHADVIVIGYGFAGATAAITAHDDGAKVLLIEKAPEKHKGGNSRVSANLVFWPNDIEIGKTHFKALAGPYMDDISDEMLQVWAEEMYANRRWLEAMGMETAEYPLCEFPELAGAECVRVLMNGKGKVGQERLWKLIQAQVDQRPIDILYETGVVHLVKQHGQITGVIAERSGKPFTIKANRGVVLTCGGFEANPKMVRNYLANAPEVYPDGTPYNTGDGVRMGIEVGADLWHMSNVSGPLLSFKAPGINVAQWINLPHCNSYLFVGADGKRFTMEGEPCSTGDRHGKVLRHGQWVQQPLPMPIYMIFDETYRISGPIAKANADWDVNNENYYDWSNDNQREIEKGWIKKADTIGALAEQIGLSASVLQETVARYNMFAAQKLDPDWGRAHDRLEVMDAPPYYAMPLTPGFVNTQGGPRRDHEARILDTLGQPIPRLYSAGELGSIYSFLYQGGGNIGECFAFGRIAGKNAARESTVISAV